MHIASTINPENKSRGSVSVAVFTYGGRRKFVVKSKHYEETLKSVKKSFGIDDATTISFSTVSLDICRGQATEIDKEAYPHLWELLDEVDVRSPDSRRKSVSATSVVEVGPAPISNGRRRSSYRRISQVIQRQSLGTRPSLGKGLPPSGVRGRVVSETQEDQVQAALIEEELLGAPLQEQEEQEEEEAVQEAAEEEEDEQYEHVEQSPPRPDEDVKPLSEPGPSIEQLWDDDEDVEHARPTSTKFDSPPISPSPKSKKPTSTSLVSVKTEKPEPKKASTSKFKPKVEPPARGSKSASTATRQPSPPTSLSAKAPKAPKTVPPTPTLDGNSRLAIIIQAPGDDLSAQFKMRGKHQIQKILKTACANFNLDYERASLWLIKEDEDDEDADPQCYELPKQKTALECGIVDGSTLVIQLEEEDEEEEVADSEEDE